MMINNLEHLNQKGCNINTAVFLEISVLRQGTLVLPLTKGGFPILYFLKSNIFFGLDSSVIYLLRAVMARLCGIETFEVFAVLIAITLVESW